MAKTKKKTVQITPDQAIEAIQKDQLNCDNENIIVCGSLNLAGLDTGNPLHTTNLKNIVIIGDVILEATKGFDGFRFEGAIIKGNVRITGVSLAALSFREADIQGDVWITESRIVYIDLGKTKISGSLLIEKAQLSYALYLEDAVVEDEVTLAVSLKGFISCHRFKYYKGMRCSSNLWHRMQASLVHNITLFDPESEE